MKQKPVINNIVYTFGINKKTAEKAFKKSGLNVNKNVKTLKLKQQSEVNKNLKGPEVGKKLKNSQKETFEFLFKIKTYRGVRHKLKYPARGQRTHTNAKTKQKFKF
jgi:small subunit ribosomal protein S13